MNTTLPRQVDELASHVGDTMSDVMTKGMDRARHLVASAEDHLPDHPVDWTRAHVPGLTPRRTSHRGRNAAILLAFVALAGLIWWTRRPSGLTEHLADDVKPDSGPRTTSRAA